MDLTEASRCISLRRPLHCSEWLSDVRYWMRNYGNILKHRTHFTFHVSFHKLIFWEVTTGRDDGFLPRRDEEIGDPLSRWPSRPSEVKNFSIKQSNVSWYATIWHICLIYIHTVSTFMISTTQPIWSMMCIQLRCGMRAGRGTWRMTNISAIRKGWPKVSSAF